jgi:hypothetical protein
MDVEHVLINQAAYLRDEDEKHRAVGDITMK